MPESAPIEPQPTFVQRNRAPLIFIALAALALLVSVAYALTGDASARPLAFTLPTLEGNTMRLADYRGEVVAMNFWASWCAPCREEMPALAEYARTHASDGFSLLFINSGESPATAQAYLEENSFTFEVGLDPDFALVDQLGISGLPVTLIINPDGQITYRHTGQISIATLDLQVQAARNP